MIDRIEAAAPVPVDSPSRHERSESTTLTTEGEPPTPPASKAVRRRYTAFVTAYIKNISMPSPAGRAYRAISPNCGWNSALTLGANLVKEPWVAARIDERLRRIAEKSDVTATEIVTGIKRIAEFDVRRLYIRDPASPGGWRMREPWELDDVTAAAIDQLTVKELPKGRREVRFKGAGKSNAWELLARFKGMLKEPEHPPIVANIQINF